MRNRGRIAAIAVAALAAVAAAGFGASRLWPHSAVSPGPDESPLSVRLHRSGRTLNSLHVTVNPSFADAKIKLEVIHTGGSPSSQKVVYAKRVAATNAGPETAASTWSGTLSPHQWRGGCGRGIYWIYAESLGPHTSFGDPTARDSESDTSERFRCR